MVLPRVTSRLTLDKGSTAAASEPGLHFECEKRPSQGVMIEQNKLQGNEGRPQRRKGSAAAGVGIIGILKRG